MAAGLRLMNPRVALFGAVKGEDQALPPYDDVMPLDLSVGGQANPLTALTLPLPQGTDWPVLSLWVATLLHARGDQVLRMKAVIRSPAGQLLLQTVRQTIQTPEILPDRPDVSGDGQLAILGRDLSADALAQSFAAFLRAANSPPSHQKT